MAGMIKFAVVRFVEECRKPVYLTHVNNLRDFYPQHAKDFTPFASDYLVKWEKSFCGEDGSHSGRYPAEILLLSVTEHEARLKFKVNYPKLKLVGTIPRLQNKSSEKVGDEKRGNESGKRSTRLKTPANSGQDHSLNRSQESTLPPNGSAMKGANRQIPSREPQDGDLQFRLPTTSRKTLEAAESENYKRSKEYRAEREKAMLHLKMERIRKGSINTQRKQNDPNKVTTASASVAGPMYAQKDSVLNFNEMDEMGCTVNFETDPLPGQYEELADSPCPQTPPSSGTVQNQVNDSIPGEVSSESEDDTVTQRVLKDLKGEQLLKVENNKVYIGKKCSIRDKLWLLKVRTAKSNSMFIRMMAQGVWGSKKLMNRTISGKGRSTQGKKKATPRKVNCCIAAFKGFLMSKNASEDAIPTLVKQARRDLASKFGDAARDNDPTYRENVKKWNAMKKERLRQKRLQDTVEDSSSSEDDI